MSFNKKLQDIRIKYELSQERLAEIMGVSQQTVSEWESGSKLPEINKLILISNRFNISLDELLKDTSAPVRKPISLIKKDNMQSTSQLSSNKSDNTVFHSTNLQDVSYSIKNNKPPENKFVQRVMAPQPVQKLQPYNRAAVAHKYLSNQGQIFHSMKMNSSKNNKPPENKFVQRVMAPQPVQKSQPYNRAAAVHKNLLYQGQIFHSMKINSSCEPPKQSLIHKLMYWTDNKTNRIDKLKGTISEEEYQNLVRIYKSKKQENREKYEIQRQKEIDLIKTIIFMILLMVGFCLLYYWNIF